VSAYEKAALHNNIVMLQANMKKYLGIYIIAAYFLINGIGGFCQLIPLIIQGDFTAQIYSPIVFNTGFLVAGCGLIWRKGWGRNFALFFNGISILVGLRHLLTYFYGESSEIISIFKGLSDFLIAGLIYFYLFKAKIKTLFPKSPVSWCILGLFLLLYSLNQDTGNVIIDTFWTILTIVGLAISGYGAKQLRESTPQNPIFTNKDI